MWEEACRPEDIGFVRRIFEYLKLVDVFQDRTPVVSRSNWGTTPGTRIPGGHGVDPTH